MVCSNNSRGFSRRTAPSLPVLTVVDISTVDRGPARKNSSLPVRDHTGIRADDTSTRVWRRGSLKGATTTLLTTRLPEPNASHLPSGDTVPALSFSGELTRGRTPDPSALTM